MSKAPVKDTVQAQLQNDDTMSQLTSTMQAQLQADHTLQEPSGCHDRYWAPRLRLLGSRRTASVFADGASVLCSRICTWHVQKNVFLMSISNGNALHCLMLQMVYNAASRPSQMVRIQEQELTGVGAGVHDGMYDGKPYGK